MSDFQVIEASKSEATGTFREVVETHQRELYRLAYRLTGNHHDAEDLSQEVFIKVHAALGEFRGESSRTAWIHRIAINTFLNRRRKKALAFMRLKPDFDLDAARNGEETDRSAEKNALRVQIDKAMNRLSDREKAAVALRFDQDYSVREVAETLDVAEGTVKSLLFRGVRKLREQLSFLADEHHTNNES